jgi:PAS domain S-box-containing protein
LPNLTFFRFLKELRFPYLLATSFLIFGLIYGAFEIIDYAFSSSIEESQMGYLHFSRGFITTLALLVWIAWTLYEYREKFQAVIRHHGNQYIRILNNASEAVIITDEEHRITFWNDAATLMLGWDKEEVRLKRIEDILKIPVASRFAKRGQQELELDVTNKENRRIFVALTMTSLLGENGKPETYAYMFRDLTARAIRQAQMERSERLASLGHMAAGVAHEIGNPLTAISSIIQLLQRKITDQAQLDQLNRVRENITRITKIVRDLVDFSRPKSPEISQMNLNETINDVIGLLRHDARCRFVTFDLQLDSKLPSFTAVPDQLYQVYLNFILNAVDACEGNPKPMVSVRTEFDQNAVVSTISDNGTGIPSALKERIFEPFFTTKEVGKGTGLGLSVSHHIISSLGGTISVDSRPGETVFVIRIPI